MQLSQDDKQVLTHFFGEEKVNALSGALNSDEGELSLGLTTNGKKLMSQSEIEEATKANQDAYIEIGMKKVAKTAGVDLLPGEKNAEAIVNKLTSSINKTFEEKYKNHPNNDESKALQQKVSEWEDKYNTLHKTYESTNTQIEEWQGKYNNLQQEIKTKEHNNAILKSLPEKAKINKEHAILIINNTLQKEENEGTIVYKRGDKMLTDPVGQPLTIDKIVPALAEEFGWIKSSGMGGGDRSNSGTGLPKFNTDDEAYRYLTEKNISPMSPEGLKMFSEIRK